MAKHHRSQAAALRKQRADIRRRCKDRGRWPYADRLEILRLDMAIGERQRAALQHDSRARELRAQLGPTTTTTTKGNT